MSESRRGSESAGHGARCRGNGLRRPSREPNDEADPVERGRDGAESRTHEPNRRAKQVVRAGWRD